MCAITGFLNFEGRPASRDLILRMTSVLAHRGPDGDGVLLRRNVAFGHRRLSIIDQEGGKQPMVNEDGQVWVTFNGEIYNYRELAAELKGHGHVFRTKSDTEVIVHAWEQWGEDCLKRFRGMFAFALADWRAGRLFLARDPFGIKPLYFVRTPQAFGFASEIQALRLIPGFAGELDLTAMDEYLWLQYIPAPRTIFKQIQKLPPAHCLSLDLSGATAGPKEYWRVAFEPVEGRTEAEWVEAVDAAVADSVKAHLVSDVPFGAFLSGGVDSSLVVANMSQMLGCPVETFSIGFNEKEFDETHHAAFASKVTCSNHHVEIIKPDALGILPKLVAHYGEPFGDSSAVPTYYVSQLARKHVPMVLSGDGADEMFGGYWSHGDWMTAWANRNGTKPELKDWLTFINYTATPQRLELWRPEFRNQCPAPLESFNFEWQRARNFALASKVQYMDLKTYLPFDILTKVDIASMMHGLEVRTPLVDLRVIELAATIPEHFHLKKGSDGKWGRKQLLKQVASKYFPPEFLHRPKMGFAMPIAHWFAPGSHALADVSDRLLGTASALSDFFEPAAIKKLIARQALGPVWLLLFLQEWLRQNKALTGGLALPKGEGRGEGEGTVSHSTVHNPPDRILQPIVHTEIQSQTPQNSAVAAAAEISSPINKMNPQTTHSTNGQVNRPRILMLADVPNWIFERHARTLHALLNSEFDFTLGFQGKNFNEDDFDLIYPLEFNLIDAAKIRNPAKYVTGIRSHLSWQPLDFMKFTQSLAQNFQAVHVVSRRLLNIFRPFVPRIEQLSHGVATGFFAPATRADQSGTKLRLGWAGNRLSGSKKGFKEIIEPLGNLPGVELVFCGYNDRNLSVEQMKEFYDSLDAYVCASDFEGNNNSLMEAASMQRAIITTDNGAVPEYLKHGESALIVERELPYFIQAVTQLKDDPALRVRLGTAAREAVTARFDWKAMGECYRRFFRNALAASKQNQPARTTSAPIEVRSPAVAAVQPAKPATVVKAPAPVLSAADRQKYDTIACPFCGCQEAETFRRSADIVRCSDCNTVYLRTRYKNEILEAIYQSYADDGSHMALPKTREQASSSCLKRDYFLKEILQFIKPEGNFLDVGCGWGAFLLNARDHGFHPRGVELTRKAVRYANDELGIPVVSTQFLDTPFEAGSLSAVTMLHVLEHLPFPRAAMDKVIRLLKPGGVFCGIVPNVESFCSQNEGERWFWLDPNYHYVHYSPATLKQHLEKAGFKVERIYTSRGDYSPVQLRQAAEVIYPHLRGDDPAFATFERETEAAGRGEEIRFFARRPETLVFTDAQLIQGNPGTPTVQSTPQSPEIVPEICGTECKLSSEDLQINKHLVSAAESLEKLDWTKVLSEYRHAKRLARETPVLEEVLKEAIKRVEPLIQRCETKAASHSTNGKSPGFGVSFCLITNGKRAIKLRRTIESIRALGIPEYEILVGGSAPEGFDDVTIVPVIEGARCGRLGEMRNRLTERARYEHLVVADDDLVFLPDFYRGLIQFGSDYEVQCVRFLNPDGSRYWDWATSGGPRGHTLVRYDETDPNVYVTGGLCILKASVARQVKWDEGRGFYQGEDADFSRRLHQAGISIKFNPHCAVVHHDNSCTQFGSIILKPQNLRQTVIDYLKEGRRVDAEKAFQSLRVLSPQNLPNFIQFRFDSFVSKRDGRYIYFSDELLGGSDYAAIAQRVADVLRPLGPLYAHFGGAGDALLLLATFLDQHPDAQVLSFSNSIPASRSFFDAFPSLKRVLFLPKNESPSMHLLLRMLMPKLGSCCGMGATPEEDYGKEWHAKLDIFKQFGIARRPRWTKAFRTDPKSNQIVLAPKGSLKGMVGSKRNIIDPQVWPELIRWLVGLGCRPIVIGTPDERAEYPAIEGCEDRRSFSFKKQLEHIANSDMLIGADSWAKSFSALAGIPTIVFESLKGADWHGKKDASDFVFLDPWDSITVVKGLAECRQVFPRLFNSVTAASNGKPAKATNQKTSSASNPTSAISVCWEGTYLDAGSLSHVNRQLTRELTKQPALKVSRVSNQTFDTVPSASAFPELRGAILAAAPKNVQVTIRHAWPPNWERSKQGALVVIQPWEYGSLPQDWVKQSAQVTEFWVPSNCVREMYIDSGIAAEKVKVVPNGIAPEVFNPTAKPMQLSTSKKFKFLFVGGTIHRKGPDLLLKAYLENFTAADDVCLVIKDFGGKSVYAGQTFESQIRTAQSQPNAPEILYLNEELAPESLPGLYTACDCFVLPYRGEGFGLTVLEAMACGLPVITTAGGATDDFVRDEFGFRIPAQKRGFGREVSGMKLAGPGWLLEPDINVLGEKMRWVTAHPGDARESGRLAGEFAAKEFSWEKAAAVATERIRQIINSPRLAAAKKAAQIVLPACAKIGHLAEARELFRQKKFQQSWQSTLGALAFRPYHPEAYLLLAEIAQAVGDGQDARLCAEYARRIAPAWKPAKQLLNQRLKGGSRPGWLALPETISASHATRDAQHAKLSVCLITKNEERFLSQCLASVKSVASQIVVVDTGSTDRTIEIAREHGAEVHTFAWCDDFSAARNAALEHATGEWILMLDADEELSPETVEKLHSHLNEAKVIAWRLPIIDVGREAEGCSYVPRLFRNAPGLFFVGRIHEQVFSSIEVRRGEWGLENRVGEAGLIHHGYTADVTRERNKVERNLKLLERAVEELPGEPHLLMNMGLELSRSGREAEALEKYREAFDVLSSKPANEIVPELRESLLTQYCTRLTAAKRFDLVARILSSPLAKSGAGLTASLHFSLGLAQMELGQVSEAATQMQQCLAKRNRPSLSPINKDIQTAAPYHCLALCLARLGDGGAAERAFEAGLKESGHTGTLGLDYARFLLGQRRPVDALHRVHEVVAENSQNAEAWKLGGQIALSQAEFLEFASDWTGEAIRSMPNDPVLLAQRAEALMLSQDIAGAREMWRRVVELNSQPRAIAGLIICELAEGKVTVAVNELESAACNRVFIDWYRKLVSIRAHEIIMRVNRNVGELGRVLPEAAHIIEAVLAEAERTEPAEVCAK